MNPMKQPLYVFFATLLAMQLSACKEKDDDAAEGNQEEGASSSDQTNESVDSVESQSEMLVAALHDVDTSMSTEEVLAHAEAQATTQYTAENNDSSCVTIAVDLAEQTITYTFDNCTGPWGRVFVHGTYQVHITGIDASGVHYETTATEIEIQTPAGTGTWSFTSQGTYTVEANTQQITATSMTTGTTPRGVEVIRDSEHTVTWNSEAACFSLDGEWMDTLVATSQTWTTTVAAFERCGLACPLEGGQITVVGPEGGSLSIHYDGDATANWDLVSANGNATFQGTAPLFCAE